MKQWPILSVIPNKGLTCNKKYLPLLNGNIKRLINQQNEIFKKYFRGKTANHCMDLTEAISSSKTVYYERLAKRLNDSKT